MQSFTVYGPTTGGTTAYGPTDGGVVAYGTSTSGVEPVIITGQPMTYDEIVQQVTYHYNESEIDKIAFLITPENVAVVQSCGPVPVPNTGWPSSDLAPVNSQVDVLLDDITTASSVNDILSLFTASNAAASDLYESEIDRVLEAGDQTSTDQDLTDHIAGIDDVNDIKPDLSC